MGGSLKVARAFGIDIKVHVSFVLVLLLGAWRFDRFGQQGWAFGAAFTLLFFGCIVLHELSHSVVAQAFGIPVQQIVLLPIGGVAQMTQRPSTPMQELLISVVGPLSNLVIATVLLGVGLWQWGLDGALGVLNAVAANPSPSWQTLWTLMVLGNVSVALFNLIPALPMDGGRVLRALLSMAVGPIRGTRVAAQVGRLLAVGMIALGLWQASHGGLSLLPVVGLFVYGMATRELRDVRRLNALAGVRVKEALNPHPLNLTPDTAVERIGPTLAFSPQLAFQVKLGDRLVGVATRHELYDALRQRSHLFVAGVMRRQFPQVASTALLEEALERMRAVQSPFVAVYEAGECIGLITEQELSAQAMLRELAGDYPRQKQTGWRPD